MLRIESEREEDGRWIAEVPALPGVLAYGETEAEARARVKVLALRVIADRQRTASKYRVNRPSFSRLHEPLASCKGSPCSRRA